MFTTQDAKAQNITLEDILNKVSEYDIYEQYLGKFKVGLIYNSPFREDKNPSFGIFRGRKGNLMFKDHGTGLCGDVIKFVGTLYNISNYQDILAKIYKDIIVSRKITKNRIISKVEEKPVETTIGIVKQEFNQIDINFWKQFGISLETLKKFNVFSIRYYLCNGIVKAIYKDDNPMYAYQVYDRFKIYRPCGDKYTKWRNNLTEYDIQGYEQLPKTGDILFITKSLKDVMTLYEMGYSAISPSSESTFIPEVALEDVKKRFKRIIILFDRDVCGVRKSRAMSLKTGLEAIFIHKTYKAKDVSDAVKAWGISEIKSWLIKTLKL